MLFSRIFYVLVFYHYYLVLCLLCCDDSSRLGFLALDISSNVASAHIMRSDRVAARRKSSSHVACNSPFLFKLVAIFLTNLFSL